MSYPGYTYHGDGRWNWTPPAWFEFRPYKKLTKTRQERLEQYVTLLLYARFNGLPEPEYDPEWIWQ